MMGGIYFSLYYHYAKMKCNKAHYTVFQVDGLELLSLAKEVNSAQMGSAQVEQLDEVGSSKSCLMLPPVTWPLSTPSLGVWLRRK